MWQQLAALLQVLHEQPDTVLSEFSRKALERCLETGTCNPPSLSKVCSSLRCSCCGEVIVDEYFSISVAIWRNQYIECDWCYDKNMEEFERVCEAFNDKEWKMWSEAMCDGKRIWPAPDKEKLDEMTRRCFGSKDFGEMMEEDKKSRDEMRLDEKVVYPNGRYKKAHWERLLEKRGVPLVPVQLGKG